MTFWRLILCLLPLAAAHGKAWGEEAPLALKLSHNLSPAPPTKSGKTRELPLVIDADRLQSQDGRYVEASGKVRIRDRRDRFEADWLRYDKETDEVTAKGHVVVAREQDIIRGDDLRMKIEDRLGVMNSLNYEIQRIKGRMGRGEAATVRFEGRDLYTLEDATYSTCPADQQDWVFRAKNIHLDYKDNIGSARQVRVEYLEIGRAHV
jgi:LPS-assembly protein